MLRHAAGRAPLRADGDALYDSAAIPHDTRWDAAAPGPRGDHRVPAARSKPRPRRLVGAATRISYLVALSVFHEDMHVEAMAYTRQTLGYPAPELSDAAPPVPGGGDLPGDVAVPGGTFRLGAERRRELRVRQREVGAPGRARAVPRSPGRRSRRRVRRVRRGRRLPRAASGGATRAGAGARRPARSSRSTGSSAAALARGATSIAGSPLEPHRPDGARELVRGGGVVPLGGAPAADRGGVGGGRRGRARARRRLSPRKRRFPWGDEPPTPGARATSTRVPAGRRRRRARRRATAPSGAGR